MSASSGILPENALVGFHRNTNSVRVDNVTKGGTREVIALFNALVGHIRNFHEIKDALGTHLEITFFNRDAATKALCMTGYNIGGAFLAVTPITTHVSNPRTRSSTNDDRRNLYVLGLPFALTKNEFAALFSRYGTVSHCVILATVDNSSRRRGFIVMSSHEEAKLAMSELTRTQIKGHTIDVSWAVVQRSQGFLDGGDRAMLLDSRSAPPIAMNDNGPELVKEVPEMTFDNIDSGVGSYVASSEASATLLVSRLPAILFSQIRDLEPLFYPFGTLKKLQIAGVGLNGTLSVFVQYQSALAAKEAKEALHGQSYVNCQVEAQFLRPVASSFDLVQPSRVVSPFDQRAVDKSQSLPALDVPGISLTHDSYDSTGLSDLSNLNKRPLFATPGFDSTFREQNAIRFSPPGSRIFLLKLAGPARYKCFASVLFLLAPHACAAPFPHQLAKRRLSTFLLVMYRPSLLAALPLFAIWLAGSANGQATCNATSPCPASAPCCSEFGFCGDDNFCLGGCNPFASNSIDSCRPNPVCEDVTHTFADNSRILSNATFFDGNATEYDWVVDKGNIMNTNSSGGELAMLLTQENGGTRLSSTRYVYYGTITATLKTGRWGGVVTAFITMSDIKDEIDWEFPGDATTQAQSNYFWQGVIPSTTNGATHKGLTDTFSNYHDYTIDWQPDALTFLIDGKVQRTVKKSDTIDPSTGVANYPSTPSRIQLSLWPAGINGTAPGTVTWAGGMINWADPDYKAAGHFYATVKSIAIKCTDKPKPNANTTSYVYANSSDHSDPQIALSNRSTMLNAAPIVGVSGMHGTIVALVAFVPCCTDSFLECLLMLPLDLSKRLE
ncbi:hypothetical protein NP233_g9803 [Leucocoprinus birnbaumii]|uniref:Uncharacterized protein n=1 Tax=Leucocoprinus birnbaumii TaxID=56174 RepID=A0AAD5VJS6_9AGAR|nr:hypothetical protein NP233_g9803 [Leucocoprinus birnbaumii]